MDDLGVEASARTRGRLCEPPANVLRHAQEKAVSVTCHRARDYTTSYTYESPGAYMRDIRSSLRASSVISADRYGLGQTPGDSLKVARLPWLPTAVTENPVQAPASTPGRDTVKAPLELAVVRRTSLLPPTAVTTTRSRALKPVPRTATG
jgi:hypothetical protein